MNIRRFLILIIVSISFFLISTVTVPAWSATRMPPFTLENVVTGEQISSTSFNGKSLLVVFFATWCPACVKEIPDLVDLQTVFGGKAFSVVGLSVERGGKKTVQRLIEKTKINYPVMIADNTVIKGFGGVYGIPTSFLVNSNGTVVKRYTGYVPHSVLERDIRQVIR